MRCSCWRLFIALEASLTEPLLKVNIVPFIPSPIELLHILLICMFSFRRLCGNKSAPEGLSLYIYRREARYWFGSRYLGSIDGPKNALGQGINGLSLLPILTLSWHIYPIPFLHLRVRSKFCCFQLISTTTYPRRASSSLSRIAFLESQSLQRSTLLINYRKFTRELDSQSINLSSFWIASIRCKSKRTED